MLSPGAEIKMSLLLLDYFLLCASKPANHNNLTELTQVYIHCNNCLFNNNGGKKIGNKLCLQMTSAAGLLRQAHFLCKAWCCLW